VEPGEGNREQRGSAHNQLAEPGRRLDQPEIEEAIPDPEDQKADEDGAGERSSSRKAKLPPAHDDPEDDSCGAESNAGAKKWRQLSSTDPDGDRTAAGNRGQGQDGENPTESRGLGSGARHLTAGRSPV
jgi:hypothetical protein